MPEFDFDLERSGSGAADDRALQSLLTQLLHRAAGCVDRAADQCPPFRRCALVLGAAVIGLQSTEDQMPRCCDAGRQRNRVRAQAARRNGRRRHRFPPAPSCGCRHRRRRSRSPRPGRRRRHRPRPWRSAHRAHSRASLAAPTTSLLTRMSGMPPQASTSASVTFCTQLPTAPRAICSLAMTGDLCVLACARNLTPVGASRAAMVSRLNSNASRSMTKAGVSISSSRMPGMAGGTCSIGTLPCSGGGVFAVHADPGNPAQGEVSL